MLGIRSLYWPAAIFSILVLTPNVVSAQGAQQQYFLQKTPAQIAAEELAALRSNVRANPTDASLRVQLGDALRKRGRNIEAAREYVEATKLQPDLYVVYHHLSTISDDAQLLDDAIERLNKLKLDKPKELMLRVAMSELLEKRQNFYQAARVLIEITYDNAVPPKYVPRVNGRIHYLLAKSKEAQLSAKDNIPADEDLDVVPAPLPDAGLRKGLTASKINESKELKGTGHTPLLP